MNKYVIKYVKDNEEFYQEIRNGRHFSTVKLPKKEDYQRLLEDVVLQEKYNIHDLVIIGEILFLNKNMNEAHDKQIFKIALELTNAKDSRGYNLLSKCYYFGVGVPTDESLAIKYLELAASEEDAISLYNLWYLDNHGVKGISKPLDCLKKAAELGEPESQLILGKTYLNNNDIYNARNQFNLAYKNGLIAGKGYLTIIDLDSFNIQKMPSNLIYSLIDKAEMDDVDSQVKLALHFLKGDEVKQNISYAHYWFSTASLAGSKIAKQYIDKYFENMIIDRGDWNGEL